MRSELPANEAERLKALYEYNILDSEAETQFNDLTEIASQICGMPIAVITLIDRDRQWFKAAKGITAKETHRDLSFCSHAILNPEEVLVVTDPQSDERFSDNIQVTGEPNIRFYAGAPLVTSSGMTLGALCVLDNKANSLNETQLSALKALSRQVMAQFELRKELATRAEISKETQQLMHQLTVQSDLLTRTAALGKIGGWELDLATQMPVWSDEVYKIHELEIGAPIDLSKGLDFYKPSIRKLVEKALQECIEEQKPFDFEWPFTTAKGRDIYVRSMGQAIVQDGKVVKLSGAFQDITERKISEDLLQKEQQRLKLALESGKIGLWDWNLLTDERFFNERYASITGHTLAEIREGKIWNLTIHEADKERVYSELGALIEGKSAEYYSEFRIQTKQGNWRWVSARAFAYERDDRGKALQIIGTLVDIHEQRLQSAIIQETNDALRKKSEELLQASLLNQAILENAGYAVIAGDLTGAIHTFNPAAEKILGYSASEVMGLPPALFHDPDEVRQRAKELSKELGRHVEPGYDVFVVKAQLGLQNESEWTYIRKDGTRVPVLLSVTQLKDSDTVFGYLGIAADISLQRQLRRDAEAATAAKSDFLANMSHEIRTPLTSIIGFTESVVTDDLKGAPATEALNTVLRNGKHLLGVINDILDLSKIESGKFETEIQPTSLFDLISDVGNLMRIKALEQNILFGFEYVYPLPKTIHTDAMRLKQILINLCGNAVKFTSEGRVKVIVSCDMQSQSISFAVTDTGIGLSEQQKNNLFKPFVQGDTSTTRQFGGTGLGLVISKELSERLGGGISVESTLGKGSVFTTTIQTGDLPEGVMTSSRPLPATSAPTTINAAVSGRILLAEDGPDNQALISFLLKKLNVSFVIVENGAIALDLIGKEKFDLVLMDMQMPVMDGYTATKKIRELGCTTPIVALTANIMKKDVDRCYEAGCNDYLGKPFERKDFMAKIGEHLQSVSSAK